MRLKKITNYIDMLQEKGTIIGEPTVKPLDGKLYELRPFDDRIIFFCAKGATFVLLHHFVKKTNKTPRREIEQAVREMNDYIERHK